MKIKTVKSVRCYKDNTLISYGECCKCNQHKNHECSFSLPDKRIEVVPMNSPHRFNRQLFKSISENIRSETLNYYTVTSILRSVKDIKEFPNYRITKTKLLSGHYKKEESFKQEVIKGEGIKEQIFLVGCGSSKGEYPLHLDGINYEYVEPFELEGQWTILCYLYEVFDLEGFSDLKIDGKYYAVKTKPVSNLKEDLIIGKNETNLIIGSRK